MESKVYIKPLCHTNDRCWLPKALNLRKVWFSPESLMSTYGFYCVTHKSKSTRFYPLFMYKQSNAKLTSKDHIKKTRNGQAGQHNSTFIEVVLWVLACITPLLLIHFSIPTIVILWLTITWQCNTVSTLISYLFLNHIEFSFGDIYSNNHMFLCFCYIKKKRLKRKKKNARMVQKRSKGKSV